MAITKIMTIKSCGDGFPGRHLKQAIDYIINPEKTQGLRYVGGVNCLPKDAFVQMKATKHKFGKTDKRQGYHIVISFEEENVEPSVAFDITTRFVEEFLGREYEAVYSVHDDTLHRHGHIIFNSVNYVNGKKFRYEKGDWEKVIQPITNRLCEEYGLSTIDVSLAGVNVTRKMSNWREYQEYNLTWKDYIKRDLDACVLQADSFEEFLDMMLEKGYEIKQNKYLAIRPQGMKRFCRCKSLGEQYTEECLRSRIETESIQTYARSQKPDMPKDEFLRRTKLTGIQKVYYARVCRFRHLEKLPYSKAWQYRDEIRKLNQSHEEYLFLVKHDIHSLVELEAVKENLQSKQSECRKERNQLYREQRKWKSLYELADKMKELSYGESSYQAGDDYFEKEHLAYEKLLQQLQELGYSYEEVEAIRNQYKNKIAGVYEKQNAVKENLSIATRIMNGVTESIPKRDKEQVVNKNMERARQPQR